MKLRFLVDTPSTHEQLRDPEFRRYIAGEIAVVADDAAAQAFVDAGIAEKVADAPAAKPSA